MASQKPSFWLTPKGLSALGLIVAASYFLLIEHRQHVWQFMPFLILLACPFMHLFMHGGHGRHEDESDKGAYQRGMEHGRKENEHHH
ncbi:DUF2933 domain-containing protein [Halopseudomonas sp.]|uniref:DUF2933 domain-containing protein n=1 Tax=Halopseudomonas sp. TaxID=2901191 RepID=UPI001A3E42E5|nr:DUF2933 domain-containing protein [Pseudomonas sp.]|tara:strand:- start:1523 stop:1783 length:261 start_codon:yes stop_codon:yes gene_type:complete